MHFSLPLFHPLPGLPSLALAAALLAASPATHAAFGVTDANSVLTVDSGDRKSVV